METLQGHSHVSNPMSHIALLAVELTSLTSEIPLPGLAEKVMCLAGLAISPCFSSASAVTDVAINHSAQKLPRMKGVIHKRKERCDSGPDPCIHRLTEPTCMIMDTLSTNQ